MSAFEFHRPLDDTRTANERLTLSLQSPISQPFLQQSPLECLVLVEGIVAAAALTNPPLPIHARVTRRRRRSTSYYPQSSIILVQTQLLGETRALERTHPSGKLVVVVVVYIIAVDIPPQRTARIFIVRVVITAIAIVPASDAPH
jgi:hypothetical protein